MGGREVNMVNTLSKINLSKIGWEGGGSTSIWIMSVNILCVFFDGTPKEQVASSKEQVANSSKQVAACKKQQASIKWQVSSSKSQQVHVTSSKLPKATSNK